MSGKEVNDEQLENIQLILITLDVSHFEKSDNDDNKEQFENILLILIIFLIPNNIISKYLSFDI